MARTEIDRNAPSPWDPSWQYDDNPWPNPGGGNQPGGTISVPSDFAAQLTELYQLLLGRAPTTAEMQTHYGNPAGIGGALTAIQQSEEYRNRQATTPSPSPSPTPGTTPAPETTPGYEVKGPLEGFDQNKLNDKGHDTIKYQVGRILQKFSPADFVKDPTAVLAALKAAGLNPTLVGKDKIDFNDGYGPIDVVRAASQGGQAWQWGVDTGASDATTTDKTGTTYADTGAQTISTRDGSASAATGLSGGVNADYLAPWTQPFVIPASATVGPMPSWEQMAAFEGLPAFQAPTAESIFLDPSYQFRVNEGARALENAAAAKGVLNSGGTLADLLNYGQKAASQEYSNIWDRDWTKYQGDWSNAASKWGMNFTANQDDFNRRQGLWDRAQTQADNAYTRAWNQWNADRDTFWTNQSNAFDKLYKTAQLGAGASV